MYESRARPQTLDSVTVVGFLAATEEVHAHGVARLVLLDGDGQLVSGLDQRVVHGGDHVARLQAGLGARAAGVTCST